jgi:hypothetical protein
MTAMAVLVMSQLSLPNVAVSMPSRPRSPLPPTPYRYRKTRSSPASRLLERQRQRNLRGGDGASVST